MKSFRKIISIVTIVLFILMAFSASNSKEIFATGVSTNTMLNNLIGEYKGTYSNSSGQVGVYLKVYDDAGVYSAILYTYSLNTNNIVKKYPLNVSYNTNKKQYELSVTQTKYPNIVGVLSKGTFSGYLTIDNKSQYKFSTTKVVYQSQASTSKYLDKILGEFVANTSTTSYKYEIFKDIDGTYTARCSFSSGGQSGSAFYSLYYDVKTSTYQMIGKNWLTKPDGWTLDDGFIKLQGNTLVEHSGYDGSNVIFKYSKVSNMHVFLIQTDEGGTLPAGLDRIINGLYAQGTKIGIAARSMPGNDGMSGNAFVKWTSSNGGTFEDEYSAITTFTMPGNDTIVTGHFKKVELTPEEITNMQNPPINANTFLLTVNAGVGGLIHDVSLVQTVRIYIQPGMEHPIFAESSPGYVFDKWTSSNGGTFKDEYSANTNFTMPRNDTIVTANFKPLSK
ncbi:MAG: hypothetical protein FWC47_14340 [Oscillospiraceae bacterium]|nr:hypothetical protein [Oscillospiraceae bacterium]